MSFVRKSLLLKVIHHSQMDLQALQKPLFPNPSHCQWPKVLAYWHLQIRYTDIIPWEVKCANGMIRYGFLGCWMDFKGEKNACLPELHLHAPVYPWNSGFLY